MSGRGYRGVGNKRGNDDRKEESKFSNKASSNQACEIYVNHFKLSTKAVYAYLIDWGEKISTDNISLKSKAKKSSED